MFRPAIACVGSAILTIGSPIASSAAALKSGAYEGEVRLELPHLEDLRQSKRARICVSAESGAGNRGIGVLSENNPLARCPLSNIANDGNALAFDIVCEGKNAGHATARYILGPEQFRGRIEMQMGGKNMTMTEVQSGHRIGPCEDSGGSGASTQPPSGL